MRIIHLAAGAGEMYCGACARDLSLMRGLMDLGHDVLVVPLYTPLRSDATSTVPTARVYMGGVSAYLQQVSGLFRHAPRIVDRLLDSPAVLRIASRFAVSTRPDDLGPMTASVLDGADGRQRLALERLFEFLETQPRPDVVSVTNTMLSGVAPELRRRLGVPVVCGVAGEDSFVNAMRAPWPERVRDRMRRNVRCVEWLVAPSQSHAETMAAFLDVGRERIGVVRPTPDLPPDKQPGQRVRDPFTVAYLSCITPLKGLDLLVAAFAEVARQVPGARLRIAGRVLRAPYWRQVQRSIRDRGLAEQVDVLGEVDRAGKDALWRGCSVACLPSRADEARALAGLEAMAHGVPLVAPRRGVFSEVAALTGGCLLYDPVDPDGLAAALVRLAADPAEGDAVGVSGWHGIRRHFRAADAAQAMDAVLRKAVAGAGRA